MNFSAGDWIAIVVAVTTGVVTISAIYIAARQARAARIQDRRTDTYVRVFRIASQITVQANQSVYWPGNTVEDDPDRELERQAAVEMALMGSENARLKYLLWRKEVAAYWPLVEKAARSSWKADQMENDPKKTREEGGRPSEWDLAISESEKARIRLIGPMEHIRKRLDELEEVLRDESQSRRWIRDRTKPKPTTAQQET
jgi:hypothetical protein